VAHKALPHSKPWTRKNPKFGNVLVRCSGNRLGEGERDDGKPRGLISPIMPLASKNAQAAQRILLSNNPSVNRINGLNRKGEGLCISSAFACTEEVSDAPRAASLRNAVLVGSVPVRLAPHAMAPGGRPEMPPKPMGWIWRFACPERARLRSRRSVCCATITARRSSRANLS